jgi:hypothetical protein
VALLLPPLAGRDRRRASFDVAGDREGRAPDLGVGPAGLDPDVDVDASGPGGLRPADEADRVERLLGDQCHLADLGPLDARHRVEVDPQLVGMVEVVGPDGMRVEVDAAEVRDPGQPGGVVDHDLVGGPPGWERQRRDPQPLRSVVRRPLLEERLLRDPIDEALQGHRPAAGSAQGTVGHRQVVVDQVHLGVSRVGEVDLVRVRDRDVAVADLEDFLAGGHGAMLAGDRNSEAKWPVP